MFFGSKRKDEQEKEKTERLRTEQYEESRRALSELTGLVKEGQETQRRMWENISSRLESLDVKAHAGEKQMRRQSESFEDLLEEWEGRHKEQEYFQAQLAEYAKREEALLALADCCRWHFQLLRQQLLTNGNLNEAQKSAWQQQLRMMDQEQALAMRRCGMEEVGSPGEAVDYETCEVLDIWESEDEGQAGIIAHVYRPGRLYQGRTFAKAQVAAYGRKTKRGEDNDNRD